ncbi:MAG: hypothetical protein GXP15_03145 [Gammaproteobacteria bacterium]|nr:hypothetical protein [Gammaproteobacteria bacterium]
MNETKSILRLRKKHAADPQQSVAKIDAQALLDEQSLSRATLGALFALVIVNALWVYFSLLFDRFYPWGSIIQGFMIGRAVRHFGKGINWRFPLLAAVFAFAGALIGSFVVSLNLTAREFSTSAFALVNEVSWYTIETFMTRDFGRVGLIYALTAAVLAAFFANRRLDQYAEVALRKRQGRNPK